MPGTTVIGGVLAGSFLAISIDPGEVLSRGKISVRGKGESLRPRLGDHSKLNRAEASV